MNFIGEPSTVMFRRQHLADVKPNISCLDGQTVRAINDLAMYANVLRHGNLAYLCEPLSCFRMHAEQRQQQGDMQELFRQYVRSSLRKFMQWGCTDLRPMAKSVGVRWQPLWTIGVCSLCASVSGRRVFDSHWNSSTLQPLAHPRISIRSSIPKKPASCWSLASSRWTTLVSGLTGPNTGRCATFTER